MKYFLDTFSPLFSSWKLKIQSKCKLKFRKIETPWKFVFQNLVGIKLKFSISFSFILSYLNLEIKETKIIGYLSDHFACVALVLFSLLRLVFIVSLMLNLLALFFFSNFIQFFHLIYIFYHAGFHNFFINFIHNLILQNIIIIIRFISCKFFFLSRFVFLNIVAISNDSAANDNKSWWNGVPYSSWSEQSNHHITWWNYRSGSRSCDGEFCLSNICLCLKKKEMFSFYTIQKWILSFLLNFFCFLKFLLKSLCEKFDFFSRLFDAFSNFYELFRIFRYFSLFCFYK